MEPNEPLNAAPQPDAAPVTTQSPAATQERPAEKPRAAVRVTQQFVVRMQRGQNEAALPPKGGKPPLRATYNAVGQLLYRVGTQAEYTCIRLGRGIRGAFRLALRAAAALLRFVGGPLLALFSSIWDDLTAPARRFASGVRHMRDAARAEAQAGGSGKRAGFAYFKNGVHAYRHLIGGALRYLMPAAALCVLVFTVQEVLGSSFSLGVSYSGDFLVFIENEGVWDSAEKMVQERVMASEGAKVEWDEHSVFELRIVDPAARTSASDLVDKIIAASSDKIMKAVGIRVNGELIGVVEDGRAVQQLLDDTLAAYNDGTHERVEFLYPIEQVPGTYFTNSVQDTTMVLQALQSSDVLSVKVTDLIEYDETLEYTTEEVESDQYNKGVRFISQRGRDGTQHVVAEQTSVNGSVISTVPVEVTVTEEMTPRIYTIGTREAQYGVSTAAGGSVVGTGSMTFPVPSLSYITTRFGSGHRGIDLCAPNGTPILAADSGTVIEAGYHWSFGNYLLIDHGNGITTRYAHCSALLVGAGSTVTRGQQIATIGISGVATGYHCHFEVAVNGSLVNPAPYLGVS